MKKIREQIILEILILLCFFFGGGDSHHTHYWLKMYVFYLIHYGASILIKANKGHILNNERNKGKRPFMVA